MFHTTRITTTRRGTWRRAAGAASAAAVLAVTLGACSPAQAGAAAVVGDRRITTAQVSDATTGIKQGNPQLAQGEGLDRTVLFFLVISPYVLSQAEANGVGVSEAEAKKLLPKTQDPDEGSVRVLQTYLALQKLQQQNKTEALTQIQKDVTAAKPELSPRFGTCDVKQMAVVDSAPNWIVPTPQSSPDPNAAP